MKRIVYIMMFLLLVSSAYAAVSNNQDLIDVAWTIWQAENVTDESPMADDLSVLAGVPTKVTDCMVGGCYSYDGNDAHQIPYIGKSPFSNNYTVSLWLDMGATPDDGDTHFGWNAAGQLVWRAELASCGGECVQSTGTRAIGSDISGIGWVHLCLVQNGTHMTNH